MGENINNNYYENFIGKEISFRASDLNRFKTFNDYFKYHENHDIQYQMKSPSYNEKALYNIEKRKMFLKEYEYFTDGIFYYKILSLAVIITCDYINTIRLSAKSNLFVMASQTFRFDAIDAMIDNPKYRKITKEEFYEKHKLYKETLLLLNEINKKDLIYNVDKQYNDFSFTIKFEKDLLDRSLRELFEEKKNEIKRKYIKEISRNINKWISIPLPNGDNFYVKIERIISDNIINYSEAFEYVNNNNSLKIKSPSSIILSNFNVYDDFNQTIIDKIFSNLNKNK